MKSFTGILIIAILATSLLSCNSNKKESSNSASEKNYACPMHPEVIGSEGDTCNKCRMKLEKATADSVSTGDQKK